MSYYGEMFGILIRTDGSMWLYSESEGLIKITESTSTEDDKPVEEEGYIKNPNMVEKEVDKKIVISGIGANRKVEDFIKQNNFNERYAVKIFDTNDKEVSSETILKTGLKVKLYKNNEVVKEYVIVIYGDTSGDGLINAFDALTLIKGINNKNPFKSEIHKEAGRIITGSGQTPTALDALAIVKSANNKYTINQSK